MTKASKFYANRSGGSRAHAAAGKLTEIETYWIAVLLAASLGALFLALLPLAFGQFAMTDAAV